jgi:hypothetical protein
MYRCLEHRHSTAAASARAHVAKNNHNSYVGNKEREELTNIKSLVSPKERTGAEPHTLLPKSGTAMQT